MTGYTRTGYCVDINGDSGSHHICIDLSSTSGGNFCSVTGQSDWCSSTSMQCDTSNGSNDNGNCPVQNWCVCQWAFASYIENAGGCDQIQEIVCDSINYKAIEAYQATAGGNPKYADALQCLVDRCGLTGISVPSQSKVAVATRVTGIGGGLVVVVVAIVWAAMVVYRKKRVGGTCSKEKIMPLVSMTANKQSIL